MENRATTVVFICGCFLLLSPVLWSDGIEVISSSSDATANGAETAAVDTAGRQTEVVLSSPGDEAVRIYQLRSASSGLQNSDATKALCIAPARLSVPGGVSYLFVSDRPILGRRFQIRATGGTQTWKVQNPRLWEAAIGITLGAAGVVGLGATAYAVATLKNLQTNSAFAGGGGSAAAVILGVILGLDARAKADLVKVEE